MTIRQVGSRIYTDDELSALLAEDGATTLAGAIAPSTVLSALVDVWADRQADAHNSAF